MERNFYRGEAPYIHNFDIFRPVLEAVFDTFEFRNNIGYLYAFRN